MFLGTALLWFGWFGFNGGSALAATARAAMAATVTTMAASSAAIAWVVVDYLRHRKISGVGFCSGAVVGLVGITVRSVSRWASTAWTYAGNSLDLGTWRPGRLSSSVL